MPGNINGIDGMYVAQGTVLVNNASVLGAPLQGITYLATILYTIRRADDGLVHTYTWNISQLLFAGPNYNQIELPEGWLQAVTLNQSTAAANPIQSGACLNQVYINPMGPLQIANVNLGHVLISTPSLSSFQMITWMWPNGVQRAGTDGAGANIDIAVGNPAAGVNFSFTFNAQQRFRIQNVRFRLVTGAAAALRQVGIKFTDPAANVYLSRFVQGTQTVTQTNDYNFSQAGNNDLLTAATLLAIPNNDDIQTGIPLVEVNDASVLSSSITNIQATDQISAIVIRAQFWNELD